MSLDNGFNRLGRWNFLTTCHPRVYRAATRNGWIVPRSFCFGRHRPPGPKQGGRPAPGLPVVLGTTSGGMTLGQQDHREGLDTPRRHHAQAGRVLHYQSQRQGLDLADAFGFTGPVTIIANACASGANAIGHAWDLLRLGRADRVLTGGYDALSQLVFSGFDSLQALSPTQCRPFDAQRDGLALGEGAAVFALETLPSALNRRTPILGEIVGYGASTDPHHLTQPNPEGTAALGAPWQKRVAVLGFTRAKSATSTPTAPGRF